jgi:Carboxypeptidase regulatory-like domain
MLNCQSLWTRAALFILSLTLLASPAMSQSFYGSFLAVVQDGQGGVIPGATVVLTNTATTERRESVSSEDGTARFVNLVPGTYRLEVELSGFQRFVREGIAVNIQSTPRIDVTLQIGSLQETVSVTGEAPLLQTENASVGTVVGSRAVQELPLNGRNILNLIAVAPTVVPQGGSEGSLTGKNVFAAGNYQIGGGVANQSASLYDGVPLQDMAYGNIVVLTPSPEAVEEFRVQTNNSSAEFGRFTGGVVNMASRSGSNAFRGSVFEFHRNKALNSNTFFGERAGLDKPPFVQNNFGGVLGGPLLRNKLFFFSSYEGYRNREGVLFRRTVPTGDMKRGDFSDYRNVGTGALVPIYDPWTQCGINNPGTGRYNGDCGTVPNRLQFPGNVIPSNRISPIAKRYLDFPVYAEPTVPGRWRTENWEKNASVGGDNDQLSFRGDYNVSQNQRIIGRYTRFESTNLPVDLYGNGQRQGDPYSPEHFVTTQVMAADTHTFNSSTVLDVRFGFLRWDYDRVPGNIGINLTSTFGLPTVPYGQISERSGIPNMESIPTIGAGSNNFISTGLLYSVNNTYSVTPTLTKLAGAHTLKIGANIMWATEDYFQNNSTGGTFAFSNNPTALDGTNPLNTGDPFASFLLGIPTGGTYQSSGWTYAATSYQALFLDDSWQVSPKVTLNLGFRVERPGAFTERDDRIVLFDRDAVNPVLAGRTNPVSGQPFLGAFELVNTNEQPDRGLRKQVWRAVPRGGIAYQLGENTVLRGGAGTFITPSTVRFQDGVNGPVIQRTNTIVTSVDNNRTFFTDMSNPFPTGVENFPGRDESYQRVLLGGTARRFYYDEEGYPGYSHQWNLALQHQFQNNLSMEVTYSGLDGNHLPNSIADNQLGREHIDRAAKDTTICSLTNNQIIPQGQPGFVVGQQDTCYGAHLRQLVTNPFVGLIREGALSTPTVQRQLLLTPTPQYGQSSRDGYLGSSRYHGLTFRAEKRFGAGGMVGGHYTYSKNMTNVETLTTWLEGGAGTPTAGYQTNDLDDEWSLSSFDIRHRVVLSFVYDLPFGEGRRFGTGAAGIANKLLSGWTLNGVTTIQSGLPLAFTATPNQIGSGYGLRPNMDPNCDKSVDGSALDRLDRWFNTACFTVPNAALATNPQARWQLGDAPRVDPDLRGHHMHNWNFALTKTTPVHGRVNLMFRAEAFNLFNRTQFGMPNTQATTAAQSNFGRVTSQLNQPRLVQLAFKLTF